MMNKLAQHSYVSIICFIFLLFRSLTKVSEMSAKHLAARCSFDAPLELIIPSSSQSLLRYLYH